MASIIRQRLAREEKGFTLIELLVVIIIIGILLAIAVPSYLSFRERANVSAAKANVRAAVPAMEAYNADNNGYTGADAANALVPIDPVVNAMLTSTPAKLTIASATATSYCIWSQVGQAVYMKNGPLADIESGNCT